MTERDLKKTLIGLSTLLPVALGSYILYKGKTRKVNRESLRGQVVVITGASTGIGKSYAIAFAKEGAKIVLAARSIDKIEQLAKELGVLYHVDAIAIQTDVSIEEEARRLIDKSIEHFGHIDILINNAGIASYSYFQDSNLNDHKKMMDVNYWGTVYCTHAAIPSMIKRNKGRIVNISSVLGKRAMPIMAGYSATKYAMQGFSDSLRVELKKYNIGITVICPTTTRTEIVNNALEKDNIKFGSNIGMSADRVAKETINAILDNKREHILGIGENIGLIINNSFPSLVDTVLTMAPKFMIKD